MWIASIESHYHCAQVIKKLKDRKEKKLHAEFYHYASRIQDPFQEKHAIVDIILWFNLRTITDITTSTTIKLTDANLVCLAIHWLKRKVEMIHLTPMTINMITRLKKTKPNQLSNYQIATIHLLLENKRESTAEN